MTDLEKLAQETAEEVSPLAVAGALEADALLLRALMALPSWREPQLQKEIRAYLDRRENELHVRQAVGKK